MSQLEDTCTQKRRLEDGREGGQGPTRTVEPWSSSSSSSVVLKGLICKYMVENSSTVQLISKCIKRWKMW